jgi:hypothetical protein
MIFNMDERAIPYTCRHEVGTSSPDCNGNNTHSWLLDKDLVYLQWEIEVDGRWGPYQECNLNLTTNGDGLWHCAGGVARTNWTDAGMCSESVCPRTGKAVGWQNENFTHTKTTPLPSAACNATAERFCGARRGNFSDCASCLGNHSADINSEVCHTSRLDLDFCPAPPAPDSSCAATAEQLCGASKSGTSKECSSCLRVNSTRVALNAVCNPGAFSFISVTCTEM